jgi:hypothetical protein
MPKTHLHGTGLRHRVIAPGEEIVGAHLAAAVVDFTKSTGLKEPPDEDQGTSNSCTAQEFGYHFWQITGCQILREDIYSHTVLSGGGAYLTSPAQFVNQYGALLRGGKYQEPNPETEALMKTVVLAVDAAGRIKAFEVSKPIIIAANINTIASLLEQYKGIAIGVDGSDAGWQNMTDPVYNGQTEWGHALYVYDRVVRNGHNALKAKSSWCNEVKNHYINDQYFNAGGVFEGLAFTAKEISMNTYVQTMNYNGTVGVFVPVSDPAQLVVLNNLFNVNLAANADGTIPTEKSVVDKSVSRSETNSP